MKNDQTHWRDSGRTPKFFMIEAQVFVPMLLCLFHFRVWTLTISLLMMLLLVVLKYYKVTLMVFLFNIREWVFTRDKPTKRAKIDG